MTLWIVVSIDDTNFVTVKLTRPVGALKLDKLEQLVVDASHIDQKKRGIMDMKETMIPLARWLCRSEFKERYTDSERPLQLLFY